jgi:hypothetical protein
MFVSISFLIAVKSISNPHLHINLLPSGNGSNPFALKSLSMAGFGINFAYNFAVSIKLK